MKISLKQVKKIEKNIHLHYLIKGMSSTFSVNDVKYFTSGNLTLMVGSLETTTPLPHSITLDSKVKSNVHVVLDKNNLGYFRNQMLSSPVTSHAVYAYDQMGNIVSRYESGRKNISTGTLNISAEPVTLLSNISLPTVDDDSVLYLPITSYSGLYSVVSTHFRQELLNKDLELFRTNSNLSKVTLVISRTLAKEIETLCGTVDTYNTNFVSLFKAVVVTNDSHVINHIVEEICGKVISGHHASFQGFMNFGSGYDVIHSSVCPAVSKSEELARVTLTNRRGGRLQVYVDGQHGLASFILILRRLDGNTSLPSFTEETTHTSVTVTSDMAVDASTFPGISMMYLKDYLDTISFQESLQGKTETKQLTFIQENPSHTVRYLFTNPHEDVEDEKNLTGMSRSLFNDFSNLMVALRSSLERNMHTSRSYQPNYGVGLQRQRAFGGHEFLQAASSVPVSEPYLGRTPSGVN